MKCDLHCHSVFSDGTWTPEGLIDYAKENEIIIALTDHNTAMGLKRFMSAAEKRGVTAVPGVEFSSDYNGKEIHILGFFIGSEYYKAVDDLSDEYKKRKTQSNYDMIKRLNSAGFDISFEKLQSEAVSGSFNRAAIAAEMKRKGYVSDNKEAFDGVLSKKAGFYIPPKRENTLDIIKFIRSINAVPVIAHPFISLSEDEITEFLPRAAEAGLMGMETRYSLYSAENSEKAKKLADRFGLLESGGSDFHGSNKPDIELITGKGDLKVPEEFYRKLYEANLEQRG